MLHVLIADDEERICQLIQALGEWQRLGLEVTGVAHNGQEALELIESRKPDILITDIRMPGYSGLEVINRVKRLLPELEVIIISGYAQFDYAQSAISSGVSEYLLKPINRTALNQTLEKLAHAILEKRKQQSDVASMLSSSRDDRERLRQKLAADLWNRQEVQSREQLQSVYHFNATADTFQTLVFQIDCRGADLTDSFREVVRQKVRDQLEPVLNATCTDAVTCGFRRGLAAVVNLPSTELAALRSGLRDALNQMIAQKSLFGAVDFTLALGREAQAAEQLQASMQQAKSNALERLIEGGGRLLEGTTPASGLLESDYLQRYAKAAAHAIDMLGFEEADAAAELLKEAAAYPKARGWELKELYQNAGRLFIAHLSGENSEAILHAYDDALDDCADAAMLHEALQRMQTDQLHADVQRRRDRDAQPIRQAKLYIRKHFADAVTLEEVSAAIGFSVNYFSTLFKKETGEGFSKYVTSVRMEEARNLLRDSSLSVAQICNQVGYGDVKHFTKTFKAENGLTPGEYRKLYG